VHRIGRTGRAGKEGTAITFVNTREVRRLQQLVRRFKGDIKQLEIPTVQDVLKIRARKALAHFENASNKPELYEKFPQLFDAISQADKNRLVDCVLNLLSHKYLRGHENEKEIPSVCPREKALAEGATRELMLHIGFDDGVGREQVLQHCLDTDAVDHKEIERVRVIKRRSFVILPSASADRLAKALKGKKLFGKPVRVTFAPQREERESFRGRSRRRFGGRSRSNGSRRRSSFSARR